MRKRKKVELAKSDVIEGLPAICAHEAAAVAFFELRRWGDSPSCPECSSANVYQMTDRQTGDRNKKHLWRCRECNRQYSVRTGTIYEESLIPLHKWCHAFWESACAKNGVSALEMSRKVQVSYKSALFMMHRIRHAMAHGPAPDPKLSGDVEVDETYVGPRKPRHPRGNYNRVRATRGTKKQPVLAMVEKGGKAG